MRPGLPGTADSAPAPAGGWPPPPPGTSASSPSSRNLRASFLAAAAPAAGPVLRSLRTAPPPSATAEAAAEASSAAARAVRSARVRRILLISLRSGSGGALVDARACESAAGGRYVWQVCAGVSWVSGVVAVDSAGVRGCRSTPARST